MDKVHHVVFHDDIDGIISAAIYLHDQVREDTYRLYPVPSTSRGEKFESMVKAMRLKPESDFLVILDYENHKKSNLWVDHHWSKIMGDEPVINSKIIYNPGIASTARLMHQSLNPNSIIPKSYSYKFLDMVDIIDRADYNTVKQIFNDTHPLMVLRAYIERSFHSEMMFCRIVEMISATHFDFRRALYQLRINKRVISELQKDIERTKKAMVISGNFSVIRQNRPGRYPRYAEFYINPKVKYSVRLSTIPQNKIYFQVGYNKWHDKPNEVDIGRLLSNMKFLIKGGGHYSVGGGIVSENNVERFLDDLCINLNDGESSMTDEMEKVGVDKENDPIESKAESMVKTGGAKNIDEAREKAAGSAEEKTTEQVEKKEGEDAK